MLGACHTILDAVASERELAAIAPLLVLINHTADAFRIGGVADPVQDDLGHRGLAANRLAAGFEVNTGGQTLLFALRKDLGRKRRACPWMIARRNRGNEPAGILVPQ